MTNRLFELFDESTKSGKPLIATQPQSLADLAASGAADTNALEKKLDYVQRTRFRIDYSNFANFVTFNSALDYFNTSGERMLNEYPYDGAYSDVMSFESSSDGYQDYLLAVWPRWSGAGFFDTTVVTGTQPVNVIARDVGIDSNNNARTGMLAMGTSSWTFEAHINIQTLPTTAATASVVFQKQSSNNDSPTGPRPAATCFYDSSGTLYLWLADEAGNQQTVSVPGAAATGSRYIAWTLQRNSSASLSWSLYTTTPATDGGFDQFSGPYLTSSGHITNIPSFSLSSSAIVVGSGVLPPAWALDKNAQHFQLGEFRVWNEARSSDQLRASYNTRVYKNDTLALYWRFAEGYTGQANNSFFQVKDYSGHRIHGTVQNAAPVAAAFWVETPENFGMTTNTRGEYVLNVRDTNLANFILQNQETAATYDRNNANLITRLMPEQYLLLEDDRNTDVLKHLGYLLARQFDELKVAIDQVPKWLSAGYTGFNDSPDTLVDDALKFWGWDAKSSFLSKTAYQYFFGYGVLAATTGSAYQDETYLNQRLETQLEEIKSEFWRRTLQNLAYIYKTKGTRESVEALFRVYGLDEKLIRLKEFGLQPDVGIQTRRINSEQSTTALRLSGTQTVETNAQPIAYVGGDLSLDMQLKFPGVGASTGSIFHFFQTTGQNGLANSFAFPLGSSSGSLDKFVEFTFERLGSTGSVKMNGFNGSTSSLLASWQNVPVFDGRWYNMALLAHPTGSSAVWDLRFYNLDEDVVTTVYSSQSLPVAPVLAAGGMDFSLGHHSFTTGTDMYVRNVKFWYQVLSDSELLDHALNPFSRGADTPERLETLAFQWEFDQDKDVNAGNVAYDSVDNIQGTFYADYPTAGQPTYVRELFDYNFIAPIEYGWNEEKIRSIDSVKPPEEERWNESNTVALEFNLVDALNEDISLMMSTMDNWNNVIGDPANRHRDSYPTIDRLRQQYFRRLSGRINFRAFADFLDFFDRSFVEIVKKLLPARTNFKGAEFVVESHMLERPKVQYTYRRQSPTLVPEGVIVISTPYPNSVAGLYEGSGSTPPPPVPPTGAFYILWEMNIA